MNRADFLNSNNNFWLDWYPTLWLLNARFHCSYTSRFALKLYKISNNVKSNSVVCSLKAAWTTIFSNNYIRNRVKSQLCPFCIEGLTKGRLKKFQWIWSIFLFQREYSIWKRFCQSGTKTQHLLKNEIFTILWLVLVIFNLLEAL